MRQESNVRPSAFPVRALMAVLNQLPDPVERPFWHALALRDPYDEYTVLLKAAARAMKEMRDDDRYGYG